MSLTRADRTEPVMIFDGGYGRQMVEFDLSYPGGCKGNFKIWWYAKKSPVLVFPVTKDREVIAVRQFRAGANDFTIEVPGGMPKPLGGETPEETAAREFLEETGYEPGKMINLGVEPFMEAPSMNLRIAMFLALDCEKVSGVELDDGEDVETLLIPLDKWYARVFRGEMLDGKTIAHSLLALPYLADIKFR